MIQYDKEIVRGAYGGILFCSRIIGLADRQAQIEINDNSYRSNQDAILMTFRLHNVRLRYSMCCEYHTATNAASTTMNAGSSLAHWFFVCFR